MKLIGIAGTNGSGKDSLGHILAEEFGFLFISVTELLREEARQRGLGADRGALRTISAEWRRESGLGVLVDKGVEAYRNSDMEFAGLSLASMRNPGEVDRIHELNGVMVWLDADPHVRYGRVTSNDRNRAEEDNVTFEEFLAQEQVEMKQSGDSATLNMSGVKDKSDIFISNDSNDIEVFRSLVLEKLSPYINGS